MELPLVNRIRYLYRFNFSHLYVFLIYNTVGRIMLNVKKGIIDDK